MAEPIHEVLPGILHWTAPHPTARLESGSHYLVEEGILIDPIAPPEGLDWFDGREIGEILLTNRHHTRSAFELQERLGATIRAPRTGMHELPPRPCAAVRLRRRAERRHPPARDLRDLARRDRARDPRPPRGCDRRRRHQLPRPWVLRRLPPRRRPRGGEAAPPRRLCEARRGGRLRPSAARPRDTDHRRRPRDAQALRRDRLVRYPRGRRLQTSEHPPVEIADRVSPSAGARFTNCPHATRASALAGR